jgi:hypothetical protein
MQAGALDDDGASLDAAAIRALTAAERSPGRAARRLVDAGLDRLPLPASGRTLARWRMLAAVGAADLGLAKVFEGHTDALAILAELAPQQPRPAHALWAVWAAEAPALRLTVLGDGAARLTAGATVRLAGTKPWCSAASDVSHALVTAHVGADARQLFAVALDSPGLRIDGQHWHAVGMAPTATAQVHFDNVPAVAVGAPGAYLARPGFWHGGAGVAACWYGAACELAEALRRAPDDGRVPERSTLRALAIGRAGLALAQSAALLRALAQRIDAAPTADVADAVRLARLSVDDAARSVLDAVLRALGPAPFCEQAHLARLAADLPLFVRQSHGDADFVHAGRALRDAGAPPFRL